MGSLSHLLLYLRPYPSNSNTIEPSIFLCYLYVHTFTHENSYDLERSGGRKSEIVKCLCPETDVSQLKVYYVKKSLLIAVADTNILTGQKVSTLLGRKCAVKVKSFLVSDIIIIIIINCDIN
jgi:hypothetical protein